MRQKFFFMGLTLLLTGKTLGMQKTLLPSIGVLDNQAQKKSTPDGWSIVLNRYEKELNDKDAACRITSNAETDTITVCYFKGATKITDTLDSKGNLLTRKYSPNKKFDTPIIFIERCNEQ